MPPRYPRHMNALFRRARRIASDRDAGASELVAEALPLLADAIERGDAVTLAVARIVCEGQPAMAPLWNACAAAMAEHQHPGRFDRVRAELERAPAALMRAATRILQEALQDEDSPQLLTLSFSGSVARVLGSLLRETPFAIVCGEGRPRYEGRRMAEVMSAAGATVTATTDAGLTSFLATATAVVVGADAIAAAYWINKVGTRGLVAGAWHHGLPVYVIGTRDKALAAPLAARWVADEAPPAEVWPGAPPGISVWNPYFEPTPVELATAFLTEIGAVPPVDVPALAERHAADISMLINRLG